ncbi:flagellar motor protein MotB [uncultured Methylobacterium sp.]|jgi:OOP family OmpA-OmpF porin|uniref:OmpA family protein n=1 Tax=uncultured Methylobacterium sp. TaxID=157278 RepID=UPI0026363751|nr:flagellar motor protein MotB [uncultured Methylobacterium sp.]
MRSIGWVAGLPLLAGLWLGGTLWAESGLDADLGEDAAGVAEASRPEGAEPWLRVERRGRDLVAFGEAPDAAERRAVLDRLSALPGPRRIVDRLGTVESVSPFVWTATLRGAGRLDLAGFRPAETGRAALLAELSPAIPDTLAVRDLARAARGAPPEFAKGATFLLRQMARLKPGATGSLSDRTLSLSGEAASVADYAALREALSAPPDGVSVGTVEVEPAQADRFVWSATRRPDGSLRLDGYAVSEPVRAGILAAARAAADGAPVEDGMRIARGLPPGLDGRALTERAFAALALLREGTVSLDGGALSVRGAAVDAQALREADALTTGSLPEGMSRGSVALTASAVSPYVVTIRRDADSLSLAGHLPDAESRTAVVAALRQQSFGERITDRTRTAEGAPAGLVAALRGAIPVLSQLARGELVARDASLSLTGESLYPEAARRLAGLGPQLAPAGWTATVTVAAPEAPARLGAEACRAALAGRIAARPVRFAPGSADLRPEFYPVLDDLAALALTCPGERFTVAGHDDPPGTAPVPEPKPAPAKDSAKDQAKDQAKGKGRPAKPEAAPAAAMPDPGLPQRRAATIVDYLLKAGIGADRIAPVPAADPPAEARAVVFSLRS